VPLVQVGRAFQLLNLIDEHTREWLAIEVARRLHADALLRHLTKVFVGQRPPDYLRSSSENMFSMHQKKLISVKC
jgi:putative transposase